MNGFDITARSLARHALKHGELISSPAGAAWVGARSGLTLQDEIDQLMAPLLPSDQDQSAAVQQLVDEAAANNRDLLFVRPGTYYFADIQLPPRADGKALRIRCREGVVIDSSVGTDTFILAGAGIDFEGGMVRNARNFAIAVSYIPTSTQAELYPAQATVSGPVDCLRIAGVGFANTKVALLYVSQEIEHIVQRIELSNCTMEGGWSFAAVNCAFADLKVDTITLTAMDPSAAVGSDGVNFSVLFGGIRIGRDDKSAQALVRRMDVRNVAIFGIADNRDSQTGGAYNTNGLALMGRNLTLEHVVMRDISNRRRDDCEGIYLKVASWTASNIDLTDSGTFAGMFLCKGDNLAGEGNPSHAIGRGGTLVNWRCENTRAFGDVHPDYGYSYGDQFAAVFLQHDLIEIGRGEVIGCGAQDEQLGAIYSSDNRRLNDLVIRNVTFTDCLGHANINIAHAGMGGGVYDCSSYNQNGAQLNGPGDVVNVLVQNRKGNALEHFEIMRNFAAFSVPGAGGRAFNVRVVALGGDSSRRSLSLSVVGNRGRNLDFGDSVEIEQGSTPGSIVGLEHDGADYKFAVGVPVAIDDAVLFPRIGSHSTGFLCGSTQASLGTLADGERATLTVVCPGARVGDTVRAVTELYRPGFEVWDAAVVEPDLVEIVMANNTGASFTAPEQKYRANCARNWSNG